MQEINQVWKKIKQNQRLKENFYQKAKILTALREFFAKENFLEIDTPTLVPAPDTNPFNEVFKLEEKNLFLTPSPEFFIKKFLASGLKNVYQITKAYRDWQEHDPLHLSEFTILEWYRDNATYLELMVDCENLVNHIQQRLFEKCQMSNVKCQNQILNVKTLKYQRQQINLSPPWFRISCKEAFKRYADINLDEFIDINKARKICRQKGYQVDEKNSWEELYHQIFLNEVELRLPKEQPLILYDYPAPLAALSKIKESDPRYAERFEFYIGGLELGNGYSELTDAHEQEKRLKADIETRKSKKMKVFDYDHDFVEALKEGLSKTAGIAVGIDRLVMLFTDSSDIHEVTPLAA
ncbi:EF-P lysine aminoacylase GenX [Candidatus Shapirobacteria bacterium CG07_land_8_20_14_0_80_39_18]|uniref:EF-P lysine aminoacylase GenX n=1 Tax=Candidatus Shapirobacteria bacterium CG07_land_8_20_14_0_80_39_18 TaxID=1974882 RepID=A0A2M6YRG0_9BACT|nr:MAG: EF-P lysine aminoacylase GenX [Candidatus Shapirobacteria bacterium CG07_land_8_20_14_0_80_39_18]